MSYRFDLSARELDQLEAVVRAKADYDLEQDLTVGAGRIQDRYGYGTLDRRKISPKVEEAAFYVGAVIMVCPHGKKVTNTWTSRGNMCEKCTPADWRPQFHYLGALDYYLMPAQLVYRLLKPALEKHGGYSITKHEAWLTVGIEPRGTDYFESLSSKEQDVIVTNMERVLRYLAARGFIQFRAIGDIWEIRDVQASWAPEELVYLV